jgi:alpha-amylase
MSHSIRLALVLHNHQPVGNFDGVIQQAYQDSYRPFLDVFEQYPNLRISLHTSGPLAEWLDRNYPDYLDRLAALVGEGRVEIVGGAFYEPILTMIPPRDRVGQIQSFSRWLHERLGAQVNGMWIAERVWEQSLVGDLAEAGIRYTILDDFHFKAAGLAPDELHGYYLTEDDGQLVCVFPGSERLRYIIPFGSPQETIDYLGQIAERQPGAIVVFADDGEKFGTWPDTKKHVYQDGWLRAFYDALSKNQSWIHVTTLAEAVESVPPVGKIYLPDASYREMTEWVLPPARQLEYEQAKHELEHDPRWPRIAPFVRGGFWRNYKVRYPEAAEMYARMMQVSRRLHEAVESGASGELVDHARRELYRGQCNCSYWHGAFGGIYLPHLRNAIYNHLIAADNLLDQAAGKPGAFIEGASGDFNFDARQEVQLAGDKILALFAPAAGGQMYELDVRPICVNLLATMTRRPEAYHRKVLAGATTGDGQAASIHDRVVFKQEGLDRRLAFDTYSRKSLLDHFFDSDATLAAVQSGAAAERGDFLTGRYEARLRRNPDRIQVQMTRDGNAWGVPLRMTKGITLAAGGRTLEIAYLVEGLPPERHFHFAVEFNFAALPAGAEDRYFHDGRHRRLGHLGTPLDLADVVSLSLVDEWLGIDVALTANRMTNLWTFPIETVSGSEGGFELVHQSVVVMPHWHIAGDEHGRWSVRLNLTLDSSMAEARMERPASLVASG